jgi:hypothetical protein
MAGSLCFHLAVFFVLVILILRILLFFYGIVLRGNDQVWPKVNLGSPDVHSAEIWGGIAEGQFREPLCT